VINATSIGMGSDEMPCDAALLRPEHIVADIVYHPRQTALLRTARDIGAKTVEGLGMLVHQAVLQQQLWTGAKPDAAVLWVAAERELATRGQ
jgi:shikimate dehydrogenase